MFLKKKKEKKGREKGSMKLCWRKFLVRGIVEPGPKKGPKDKSN
jgi:hypothetical protein